MRAGFQKIDITPPVGVPMGGNSRADSRNRGVHDPLFATIAVVEGAGGEELCLISYDLVALNDSLIEDVRKAIQERGDVDPSSVVMFATHTHSGPATNRGSGFDTEDYSTVDVWQEEIVPRIAEGVSLAVRSLQPAQLELFATEAPGFAFNRRMLLPDGTIQMNWTEDIPKEAVPAGPVDDRLTAWTFTDEGGQVIGAMVHFTLHAAVLVGYEWLTSSDYIDSVRSSLAEIVGDIPILYAGGAFGNINHLDPFAEGRAIGFGEAERIGSGIAEALKPILEQKVSADQTISLNRFEVELKQRTIDAETLEFSQRMVEENAGRAIDALDGRPPIAYALWNVQVGQYLEETLPIQVTVAELGGVTLVFLPFEVFVEFGLALKKAFPDRLVKVVSLAEGSEGYLPVAKAFDQGGYEPTLGTSTISQGEGEQLFEHITTWLHDREQRNAQ